MRLKAFAVAVAVLAGPSSVAAQSSVADGVAALARGDYQRAAEILRPIAERESDWDPAAQFFLGSMYEAGLGVPRDPLRACALYHRASVFVWHPGPSTEWSLSWNLFEVVGSELRAIADETPVMTAPSRPGPSPAEDVRQHVTVRPTADGQVEWAILAGPKARSGLIESGGRASGGAGGPS
jgi:hypothetical protein